MVDQKVFDDFEEGERYETDGRTLTNSDIRMFAGATGSTDPIHVDQVYAEAHPLVDSVVVQGTLLLAVADGFLVDAVASDAALAMNYGHDHVRYPNGAAPGDTVHAIIEVMDTTLRNDEWGLVTANVELINEGGETVLVDKHKLLIASNENSHL